jgi:alpha-1,2-mannosyltransferase
VAIVAAAAGVVWVFARPAPADLRLAVLLAATILAAPHVAGYDMLLLALAAALLFCHAIEHGFGRFDLMLALVLWLAPLYGPPRLSPIGYAAPILAALFIASCGCRAGAAGTSASSRIS